MGAALGTACGADRAVAPAETQLTDGTWGGDTAAVIVSASGVHVHIGCTLGDLSAPVLLDDQGGFTLAGTYVLRAYPVQLGPELPAQFSGQVRNGTLTLSVTVNDTVDKRIVLLGPVTVQRGVTPMMANCPICRVPDQHPGVVTRLWQWLKGRVSRS